MNPMSSLRWFTAGESHGPELLALLEGIPAGLPLPRAFVDERLARRQKGYGRGGRMKIERDEGHLVAGVRGGETLGSPIAIQIHNRDFAAWQGRMGPDPFEVSPEAVTRPRPGHADLSGGLKYDRHDLRDILERASARETAARVAVGAVAERLLLAAGIRVVGLVRAIGGVVVEDGGLVARVENDPTASAFDALEAQVLGSDLSVAGDDSALRSAIHAAGHDGDTLGGEIEVLAVGVPPGLGSHVQWDRKLDGRLAQALMSIQAMKAVSIGDGWTVGSVRGSQAHDAIGFDGDRRTYPRSSNHAGGIEGGMSNGMPIVCRVAMKPIATLRRALPSVDIRTKEPFEAAHERSDICAVGAGSVIAQAMVSLVLADALLEKTGGDSLDEVLRNLHAFRARQEAW
jgi:chorismate synthase